MFDIYNCTLILEMESVLRFHDRTMITDKGGEHFGFSGNQSGETGTEGQKGSHGTAVPDGKGISVQNGFPVHEEQRGQPGYRPGVHPALHRIHKKPEAAAVFPHLDDQDPDQLRPRGVGQAGKV